MEIRKSVICMMYIYTENEIHKYTHTICIVYYKHYIYMYTQNLKHIAHGQI